MASFRTIDWHLRDAVKSRRLPGMKLIVTAETGTRNEFGIYNCNEGNPTSAYTSQGRDGYKHWKGQFKQCMSWDRDTMSAPPDNLHCVHVTEVTDTGVLGKKHGWLFTDELEPRVKSISAEHTSAVPKDTKISAEKVEQIKGDVQQRRHEIQALQAENHAWDKAEEAKLSLMDQEIVRLRELLQRLEKENQVVHNAFWEEQYRRGSVVMAKQKDCDDIIHQHDEIDF